MADNFFSRAEAIRRRLAKRDTRAQNLVAEYRILLGNVTQALEAYDSDDGLNTLVLAAVGAELRRLEGEVEKLWPRRKT